MPACLICYARYELTLVAAILRHILHIRWQDRVRKEDILASIGLSSVLLLVKRQEAIFRHIVRLRDDIPAHSTLWCHVELSLRRLPDKTWESGSGMSRWLDQFHKVTGRPPADLWRSNGSWSSRREKVLVSYAIATTMTIDRYRPLWGMEEFGFKSPIPSTIVTSCTEIRSYQHLALSLTSAVFQCKLITL